MAIERDGVLHPLEVKRSVNPSSERNGAFNLLDKASVPRGNGAVLCISLTVGHQFCKRYCSNLDHLTTLWCRAIHLLGVLHFIYKKQYIKLTLCQPFRPILWMRGKIICFDQDKLRWIECSCLGIYFERFAVLWLGDELQSVSFICHDAITGNAYNPVGHQRAILLFLRHFQYLPHGILIGKGIENIVPKTPALQQCIIFQFLRITINDYVISGFIMCNCFI